MGHYVNPTSTVRKLGPLHSEPYLLVTTFTTTLIEATTTSDLDDCGYLLPRFPPVIFSTQPPLTQKSNCVVPLLRSPMVPHLTQKEKSFEYFTRLHVNWRSITHLPSPAITPLSSLWPYTLQVAAWLTNSLFSFKSLYRCYFLNEIDPNDPS